MEEDAEEAVEEDEKDEKVKRTKGRRNEERLNYPVFQRNYMVIDSCYKGVVTFAFLEQDSLPQRADAQKQQK